MDVSRVLKLRFRGEMDVNCFLLQGRDWTYESDLDGAAEAGLCSGHFWIRC